MTALSDEQRDRVTRLLLYWGGTYTNQCNQVMFADRQLYTGVHP